MITITVLNILALLVLAFIAGYAFSIGQSMAGEFGKRGMVAAAIVILLIAVLMLAGVIR